LTATPTLFLPSGEATLTVSCAATGAAASVIVKAANDIPRVQLDAYIFISILR
jgi:hypothetical protein